jgi:broad specificity phosphatase PhoE
MKQIILIRHGEVDIEYSRKIDSLELQEWVKRYDNSTVKPTSLPSEQTKIDAQDADIVLTSILRRAIDSAKVLGVEVAEENPIFNEAAIPEVNIPFFTLRPRNWLFILRLLLVAGLGKKERSLKASQMRAQKASAYLIEHTKHYNCVALVGHGGMNWLIRKALLNQGWVLKKSPSNRHWGVTLLEL